MSSMKNDEGKIPLNLVPTTSIHGAAKAFAFGAKKYKAENWREGTQWSRIYASLLRHLTAWYDGESVDLESGCSHLDCALAQLMMLQTSEVRGYGEDDRPAEAERVRELCSIIERHVS